MVTVVPNITPNAAQDNILHTDLVATVHNTACDTMTLHVESYVKE